MTLKDLPEIGHVGYFVENADRFADMFDRSKTKLYDFIPTRFWSYGKPAEGLKLRIAFYQPDQGPKYEFIEFISGEGSIFETYPKTHGYGINHTAYYVDSQQEYDQWHQYFESLPGTEFVYEADIEDEVMGKRSSFYVVIPVYPSMIEISKRPDKMGK